ncbi:MAG: hypothetical protein IPO09_20565 [Anaeromyxobacter sp.]|nr:hypothetical protein [Anaeromyxobacter sp.]
MSDLEGKFDWAVKEIEQAYVQLHHRMGWRFLLSPRRTFVRGARTVLLSLHPGGNAEYPEQPKASCERGSAYLLESWHDRPPGQAPLQVQVQKLLDCLGETPDTTLAAYFLPFRAPDGDSMAQPEKSREFAVMLWNELLPALDPQVLVVLGADTYAGVAEVLGNAKYEIRMPVGWGSQTATLAQFGNRLVVRFPHLSQFKIFSRAEGLTAAEDIARRVEAFRKGSDTWRR